MKSTQEVMSWCGHMTFNAALYSCNMHALNRRCHIFDICAYTFIVYHLVLCIT